MAVIRMSRLLAGGLLFAAIPARAAQPRKDWRFSSSFNHEAGTYGTGVRSSSLYVPFTAKRLIGDAFASLTVPYVSQTTDGGVSNVGGKVVKSGRGRGTSTKTTQSGLGDVIARAGCDLMVENPEPIDLSVVGKVKLPTARSSKGLGTGEFDAGVGIEAAKTAAPGWTVLADLYFTRIGDPPGLNLNNQIAADVGVAHLITTGLTGTALLEGSNAIYPGASPPIDMRAMLDYRLADAASINGGLLVGLSSAASDFGFSFGGVLRF